MHKHNIMNIPKIRDWMKEGDENVACHNFREELYLFYPRDRDRMNKFDGVRAENSVIIQKTKDIFLSLLCTQWVNVKSPHVIPP